MMDEPRNSADEFEDSLGNGADMASNIANRAKGSTPSRPSEKKASSGNSQPKGGGDPASAGPGEPGTPGNPGATGGPGGKGGPGGDAAPGSITSNAGNDATNSTGDNTNKSVSQNPESNAGKGGASPDDGKMGPGDSINPPQNGGPHGGGQNGPGMDAGNSNAPGVGRGETPSEGVSVPQNNASDAGTTPDPNDAAGAAGESSANSVAGGAAGETGSSAAGSAAGSSGGAAAGSGGAAAGGAAGSSAAGAGAASAAGGAAGGAAGSAAGGATAGATVGSAAGPAGTVAGAAAGVVISAGVKLLFKLVLVLVFFIAIFMSHPSFLYDNPKSTTNRTVLEDSYNSYFESIEEEYRKDIGSAKLGAYAKTYIWQQMLSQSTRLNPVYASATFEGTVTFSDEDIEEIRAAYDDDDADWISWYSDLTFIHPDDVYLKAASSNINLVLSMIDLQKKNWFVQLWDWFANTVTGGWYSNFITSIETWWNGFWNDFITNKLYKVEVDVEYFEEYMPWQDPDDDDEEPYCYYEITVTYTFDLVDKGVGFYANKMGMDEEGLERATEMAYYLGDLFGTLNDEYFGFYVSPGYWDGEYSAGSHTADIQQALEKYAEQCDGLIFDRSGTQVFPLEGYSDHPIRSHYGPRPDFPQDPFHTGIDFSVPQQTPVLSIADGVVLCRIVSSVNYGNRIYVYHGSGVVTMYAHLYDGRNGSGGPFADFKPGDTVRAGDVIGYVGTSGLSTGNHLHFQVFDNYVVKNPVGFFHVLDYALPNR